MGFSDVAQATGIWFSLGQLETLLAEPLIRERVDGKLILHLRDRLASGSQAHVQPGDGLGEPRPATCLDLLCDMIVFENVFLDSVALRSTPCEEQIKAWASELSEVFVSVQPSKEAYEAAITSTEYIINNLPEGQRHDYLERHYGTEYWDGTLKFCFDQLTSKNSKLGIRLPPQFVDSSGTIERLIVYTQIQRLSGAPVRLSTGHLDIIHLFDRLLPPSIKVQIQRNNPQVSTEATVASKLFDCSELDAPPLFDLIMRELGRDGIRRRLTDVVSEIRQWPETIAYRRWLWRYYRTLAGRDPVRGQKLLDDLGKHLQAMRRLGDPLTSRTKTLKFEISAFFFGLPAVPQIWRDLKDSYVGFIGEWFEPTARASRSN